MPLTGIATIALDEIIFNKQQTIERCLRYLSTDTVRLLDALAQLAVASSFVIWEEARGIWVRPVGDVVDDGWVLRYVTISRMRRMTVSSSADSRSIGSLC